MRTRTPRLLWSLITYAPWTYLLAGLCWTLSWVLALAPGLIAKAFFDALTGHAPARVGLYGLIALLLMAEAARLAVSIGATFAERTVGLYHGSLLRKNMFRGILQHPGARTVPVSPGEAINRFRDDVSSILGFLGLAGLLNLVSTVVFAAVALTIMLRINARVTLLVFLPLVGVLIAVYVAGRRIDHYRQASRQATGAMVGALGEALGAVQAIKVANAEPHVVARLRLLGDRRRHATLRDQLITSGLDALFGGAVSLGASAILLVAAGSMRTGAFSIGDFALFVYNLSLVTDVISFFGTLLVRYKQAGVSMGRMADLLQGEPPEGLVEHGPVYLSGPLPDIPVVVRTEAHYLDWSSMTSPAPSTRIPSASSGSACSPATPSAHPPIRLPAWSCRTASQCCAAPITLSCSTPERSRPRVVWRSCWHPPKSSDGCGATRRPANRGTDRGPRPRNRSRRCDKVRRIRARKVRPLR